MNCGILAFGYRGSNEPIKQITWVLRSARKSTAFWEKMGFRKSDVAMEIVRTE